MATPLPPPLHSSSGDSRSALLMVDVQKDFCRGGSLSVPNGDAVASVLNTVRARHGGLFCAVFASQDWHPRGHASFASSHPGRKPFDVLPRQPGRMAAGQTLWPDHCVQGSRGAEFVDALEMGDCGGAAPAVVVVQKGMNAERDSYSAFRDNEAVEATELEGKLRERAVDTVYIGGLATDVCVKYTALDSVRAGFRTFVIEDACVCASPFIQPDHLCRPYSLQRGLTPEGVIAAFDEMRASGIFIIRSSELAS